MGRLTALALATLALAACGSGERAAEPSEPAAPATTGSGGVAQITGVGLDGEELSLAEFRGRPLLLNVWSSW